MKNYLIIISVSILIIFTSGYKSSNQESHIINSELYTCVLTLSFQDVVDAQFIAGNNLELLLDTLIVKGTFNTKNSPQFQNLYTELNKNYQLQGEQYYIFGTILTQSEIELLFKYPQHIASWISSSEIAMSKTSELFSSTNDGSIANAFLHTYWNVLMVKKMSFIAAEEFATAHENYSENPIMHKSMDLYNNEMGRNFANSIIELSNKPNDWLAEQTNSPQFTSQAIQF